MQDVKPIFDWATRNGDVKVVGRILIKLLPIMLKHNIQLTESMIKESDAIDIPDALYDEVLNMAVSLVGQPYAADEEAGHV